MKSCLLSLLCLLSVVCSFARSEANLKETKPIIQTETYHLADTVSQNKKHFKTIALDCVTYDTIRLVQTGWKFKKKRLYYTDKECVLVELSPKKNTNRFGWNTVFKFLTKVLSKI